MNNLYKDDEEVRVEIFNHSRSLYDCLDSEKIFFKEVVHVGRAKENDLQTTKDPYTAPLQTKIDFTKWFRKRRSWIKKYNLLLRTRCLPTDLCRYIMDYIKEPRTIIIKDCGCNNSTLVGLTMNLNYPLRKGMRFRLPQAHDFVIENITSMVQKDDESIESMKMMIENNSCDVEIHYDFTTRENKESYEYHILCFEVSKIPDKQRIMIVSNKSHSSYTVGRSYEASVYLDLGISNDFQYEINLDNGIWSVKEQTSQGCQQKMWLNLRGEPDKEYKIVTDTEISIGRTLVKVVFPSKTKCEDKIF